jgi:RNA 2',3'-cyclic 3'-phosphodiesterase
VRCFVALDFPAQIQAQVEALLEPLRPRFDLGWAHAPYHLTLVFLGETAPERVEALGPQLDEVCARRAPFELALAGAGTFGRPATPRVLWLGVEGAVPAAAALQRRLAQVLGVVDPNHPDWSPHLTVARAKPRQGDARLLDAAQELQGARLGPVKLDQLTLFESQAGQYLPLHRAALRGVSRPP